MKKEIFNLKKLSAIFMAGIMTASFVAPINFISAEEIGNAEIAEETTAFSLETSSYITVAERSTEEVGWLISSMKGYKYLRVDVRKCSPTGTIYYYISGSASSSPITGGGAPLRGTGSLDLTMPSNPDGYSLFATNQESYPIDLTVDFYGKN